MRNFIAFALALALGFFGATVLSHVPRGLTATSDVGIEKAASLTSVASTDSNVVEVDSIPMKISVPYFVLPIPDKKLNISYPLSLSVDIINNTPNLIQAGDENLTPELVAPDGQVLQLQKARNQNSDTETFCRLVKPGTSAGFSPAALAWKNNLLQLFGEAGLGYRWYFDDIKPGTYQLSFSYYSPGGEVSCFDLETQKVRTVKGLGTGKGTTTRIPIRIVQPVSIDSNTVEIDGVRFEIVMPEQVLPIPANKPNATTPIKIGLRITNKTANPLRFQESYKTLQIRGQDGKTIQGKEREHRGISKTAYNCPHVHPGESVTFNLDTKLSWENNLLQLAAADGDGGSFRYFGDLKPGKYQIGIGYNPWVPGWPCDPEIQTSSLSGDKWKGLGSTPFVEFRLVQH